MKAQELKDAIATGTDYFLLDVREKAEVEGGDVIEGSVHIPMGQVFLEAAKGALPKDKKIITICRSGTRAGIVARELAQKGYDIEALEGGMEGWR